MRVTLDTDSDSDSDSMSKYSHRPEMRNIVRDNFRDLTPGAGPQPFTKPFTYNRATCKPLIFTYCLPLTNTYLLNRFCHSIQYISSRSMIINKHQISI